MGILYCVKFSQNNFDPVSLLEWVGIVSSFFSDAIFLFSILFILFFTFGFFIKKTYIIDELFTEYLQHVFEHAKNNYRMPY